MLIQKRNGNLQELDDERIYNAILAAMKAAHQYQETEECEIHNMVSELYGTIVNLGHRYTPTVEEIQDLVEEKLMEYGFYKTAKRYILYRSERAIERSKKKVSKLVESLYCQSAKYFPQNKLGYFVYLRTYSKWIEAEGRRETWVETVTRYMNFMKKNLGNKLTQVEYDEIEIAILKQEVMPSMRLMQFAGEAVERSNVCAYNCSFVGITKLKDFAEIMYVLMCGTGVGYSVERHLIDRLPEACMNYTHRDPAKVYIVPDTREGWCRAVYKALISAYKGYKIHFDYSLIRPAGARLVTMGGRSSGPQPLKDLIEYIYNTVFGCFDVKLTPLMVHGIICKMGEVVVAGGVRRSALISLSDLDDPYMRDCKHEGFYNKNPEYAMCNNSAVYDYQPTDKELLNEWQALIKSGSGERGIFNRWSPLLTTSRRDDIMHSDEQYDTLGTNPCGEIVLRSKQFCNLTEVVARADDDLNSLRNKIRIATIIGTYQATLTNFPYVSMKWKQNCEEERLLGVSITGVWDCPLFHETYGSSVSIDLDNLRGKAIKTNIEYANRFCIQPSTAITCVKPSGNVSQLVNSSSGLHPRHSEYYIRRVRISVNDPILRLLRDQGVPCVPEVGQNEANATTWVVEFPVKSPPGMYKDDVTAMQLLALWSLFKIHYTEHNPSVTVSVAEDEWIEVLHFLKENWNIVGGLSFLPRDNNVYKLMPYEAIDKAEYERRAMLIDTVDFSKLPLYETEDSTDRKSELACVNGQCDI